MSKTKHYLNQNVSKSFEFENWLFWEEFVYVRDHPKKLDGRVDRQVEIQQKTKKQIIKNKKNYITKHHKWFIHNRKLNRGVARTTYHLDKIIKFFTISTAGWHRLMRLFATLLSTSKAPAVKLNYELVKKIKQVRYLIAELDYLVISRIESGVLPSYRIDRSTKRGYASARRRFRVAMHYIKKMSKAPNQFSHNSTLLAHRHTPNHNDIL